MVLVILLGCRHRDGDLAARLDGSLELQLLRNDPGPRAGQAAVQQARNDGLSTDRLRSGFVGQACVADQLMRSDLS